MESPRRVLAAALLVASIASCGGATSSGTSQLPSAGPSLTPLPQQLSFSGLVAGALSVAVVPVCGRELPGLTFEVALTGKVADRVRVSVTLQVVGFAGPGTYSFAQGSGFVIVYGPPKTEYYAGSSPRARKDTMIVDQGEKTGAVSVGFYNQVGDQQPALRLIGTWRCQ
jgi:hypothetical protein